ncbi:MAG: hypothetical protein Q9169_001851 [Polycauliona sp. 2 TL-2023]
MGVQAYLARLALGRSAHDPLPAQQTTPLAQQSDQRSRHTDSTQSEASTQDNDWYLQQYDDRGYPENTSSRLLSRRSRQAQNDVLAAVGILLPPGQLSQDTHHTTYQPEPSTIQTEVDIVDDLEWASIFYHASIVVELLCLRWMTSTRRRLQTFRFYTGVPFHRILVTELRTFGPLLFLLGGSFGGLLSFLMSETLETMGAERIRGQVNRDWTSFSKYFRALIPWWGSSIGRTRPRELINVAAENPRVPEETLSVSNGDEYHVAYPNVDAGAASPGAASEPSNPSRGHSEAAAERGVSPRASRSSSTEQQNDADGSNVHLTLDRSQSKRTNLSKPMYRANELTTFMTHTLARSLSTIVGNILLLPLEALLVRSVAFAYLNTAEGAAHSATGLRNEIYPLRSWLGNGLRGGRAMDYVRKMVLCFGVDMLLSFAMWQVTTGAAWIGMRKIKTDRD